MTDYTLSLEKSMLVMLVFKRYNVKVFHLLYYRCYITAVSTDVQLCSGMDDNFEYLSFQVTHQHIYSTEKKYM